MRPKGSGKALERRRLRAVDLLYKGYTSREVAKLLGVDIRSIQRWRQTFQQKGKMNLLAKTHPGRPRRR